MTHFLKKNIYCIALAASALLLNACAQQAPITPHSEPTQTSTETNFSAMKQVEKTIVFYQCERDFGEIEMRFFPQHGVAVLVLEGKTHELQQQPAASGMWYTNGRYTFRGKGQQGWLEIGRMAAIDCVAK